MKFKLTASAVLCAALISGCSSAPTLAVPTGEWENFTQQYQPAPQPAYTPLPVAAVELPQGPITTVYTPNPVVAFTPPPGSTPVKPAAASVLLPVSEKTVPQAPAVTPSAPPAVATTVPVPAKPVNLPNAVGAKPAVTPLAKQDALPGKPAASVVANPTTAKLAPAVPSTPPVAVAQPPKPLKAWPVSPQNKTLRETLAAWAPIAGYTFNPLGRDYWTVPQDFDVVGSETFHGDFKDAVRKLIASTELTSTPLQPCFFSNDAVRVIPINEECAAQASQGRKK